MKAALALELTLALVLGAALGHAFPGAGLPGLLGALLIIAVSTVTRVRDRKQAEEALVSGLAASARANARALSAEQLGSRTLVAVLDTLTEGIWITDARGVVLRHNDALKEMLFAGQDLVGQRPMFLVRNLELHEAVMRACQSQERLRLVEVTMEGVRPRILQVMVAPLRRELPGSVAVFRDVTELRRLERMRQDLVANVSHELRTPITAIRGYAETLRAGALADTANASGMVEIIHRQSERLSELVSDLLDLARLDAGELELTLGAVPLEDLARKASEAVGPKAEGKRVTVALKVAPGLCAFGDERAVEQVLINLLDNAIKYTPEGGRIEVIAERRDSRCEVSVRDNGPGIESKHLPRLFERFYRVDRGRSRDMGGTGLGLSIVKHLVTAMSGEVRVTSQPGEGSTFTVSLPAT